MNKTDKQLAQSIDKYFTFPTISAQYQYTVSCAKLSESQIQQLQKYQLNSKNTNIPIIQQVSQTPDGLNINIKIIINQKEILLTNKILLLPNQQQQFQNLAGQSKSTNQVKIAQKQIQKQTKVKQSKLAKGSKVMRKESDFSATVSEEPTTNVDDDILEINSQDEPDLNQERNANDQAGSNNNSLNSQLLLDSAQDQQTSQVNQNNSMTAANMMQNINEVDEEDSELVEVQDGSSQVDQQDDEQQMLDDQKLNVNQEINQNDEYIISPENSQQLLLQQQQQSLQSQQTPADEFEEIDKKNVVKNFAKAFKGYLLTWGNPNDLKNILGFCRDEDLNKFRRKYVDFEKKRMYNNKFIKDILLSNAFKEIFTHFMENEAEKWLLSSKVEDKRSHMIALRYYIEASFDPFLLEKLKVLKEKRRNRKIQIQQIQFQQQDQLF